MRGRDKGGVKRRRGGEDEVKGRVDLFAQEASLEMDRDACRQRFYGLELLDPVDRSIDDIDNQ